MRQLILVFMVIGSLVLNAQRNELVLASDVWPPFTNVSSEGAVALSLVGEALSRNNVSTTMQIIQFEEVLAGIGEGRIDGSAALWKTSEREQFLLYSEPYLQNRLILVGARGSDVSAATLGELKGKRIAVVGSYAYGENVDEATAPEFVRGESDQDNLERLLSAEVDFMLVDDLLIQYLLNHHRAEVSRYLEIGTVPLFERSLHFAIRKDIPGAALIISEFNSRIKEMIQDGTYHEILDLTWINADVDGDGTPELVLGGSKAGTTAPSGSYNMMSDSRDQTQSGERYFIDGQVYQGWGNVPGEYKVPDLDKAGNMQAPVTTGFKF